MHLLLGANRFLLVPALLAAQPLWHTDEPRRIAHTDLYSFRWVADPQLSPDGKRVAYVQVAVSQKRDSYETSLWIAALNGREAPRRLTSGTQDLSPAWSPDGETLAFLRAVKDSGELQPPQLYLLRMDGGEAQRLTNLKKGAGAPVWSPDGKTIAFASSSPASEGIAQPKRDEPDRVRPDSEVTAPPPSERRDSGKGKEEESDVRQLRRDADPGLDPEAT